MPLNHGTLRAIRILGWAGMLLALYDYGSRVLGIPLFCPFAGDGCDIVQNSPYAVLFGIPLALLGVFGFGAYVVLAHLGSRTAPGTRWPLQALLALNLVELASMAYFIYLELAVIHAVCSLCMISAALNLGLTVAIIQALWTDRRIYGVAPPGTIRR